MAAWMVMRREYGAPPSPPPVLRCNNAGSQKRAPASPLHPLARQAAGLLHPVEELRLVEGPVLVDVEVAHLGVLGLAGRHRLQGPAAEEGHLHVAGEAVEAEEPAVALAAVEGRVPLHRLG